MKIIEKNGEKSKLPAIAGGAVSALVVGALFAKSFLPMHEAPKPCPQQKECQPTVCQVDLGGVPPLGGRIGEFAECPPEVLNPNDKMLSENFLPGVRDSISLNREFYVEQHGAKKSATIDVDTRVQLERGKAKGFRIVSSCSDSKLYSVPGPTCREKTILFAFVPRPRDWEPSQVWFREDMSEAVFRLDLGKDVPRVLCTLVFHQNFLVTP